MSCEQLARRTGLTAEALQRLEAGSGGLSPAQLEVLGRVLRPTLDPPRPRPMLDLGLAGTLVLLIGAAIPLAMMLVTGFHALRFITAERAVAEVVGFERRTRVADPETGPRYTYETVAPLLRFRPPGGTGEITIPWRDTLPAEAEFAVGDRMWVNFPRGAPESLTLSLAEVMLTPMVCAVLAAPLLGIGLLSLRHLRRRQKARTPA